MGRLILSLLVGLSALDLHAEARPDSAGVCYVFDGDTLLSSQVCITNFSIGAGGHASYFKVGKNKFLYESACTGHEEKKGCLGDLNGKPAKSFSRNAFYDRIQDDDDIKDPAMYCYQQVGVKRNYCHN